MPIPPDFEAFCATFDQDVLRNFTTSEDMIARAVRMTTPAQAYSIRTYLDELLDGSHSVDELHDVWRNTPAQIDIFDAKQGDNGILNFFRLMRSIIERHLAEQSGKR